MPTTTTHAPDVIAEVARLVAECDRAAERLAPHRYTILTFTYAPDVRLSVEVHPTGERFAEPVMNPHMSEAWNDTLYTLAPLVDRRTV